MDVFFVNKFCRTSRFKCNGFRETCVCLFLISVDLLLELEGAFLDRREHITFTCSALVLISDKVCTVFYVYGSVDLNIFYEITNRCSSMQSILFHC